MNQRLRQDRLALCSQSAKEQPSCFFFPSSTNGWSLQAVISLHGFSPHACPILPANMQRLKVPNPRGTWKIEEHYGSWSFSQQTHDQCNKKWEWEGVVGRYLQVMSIHLLVTLFKLTALTAFFFQSLLRCNFSTQSQDILVRKWHAPPCRHLHIKHCFCMKLSLKWVWITTENAAPAGFKMLFDGAKWVRVH